MGASEEIRLLIRAETQKAVKEMQKFSKELDNTGKKTKSAEKTSMSFGKTIAGVTAVVGGLAAAYKLLIEPASQLEEAQSKFDVVFSGNIDTALAWRDTLVESYAMSTLEATKYLAATQDLLVPMGFQADVAGKLSNQIVKMSADLGSFNNLPTAQVIQDINSALVGNSETVKKYGIVLNETVIRQRAQTEGLIQGKGPIDAQTKAYVALKLIQEGSAAAQGDMARTAGSFANVMKRLQANLIDTATEIGGEMLPGLTMLGSAFADAAGEGGLLNDIASAIARKLGQVAGALALLVRAVSVASAAIQRIAADDMTEAEAASEQFEKSLENLKTSFSDFKTLMEEPVKSDEVISQADVDDTVTKSDFMAQRRIQNAQRTADAEKNIRAQFNAFVQSDFEQKMAKLEEQHAILMESKALENEEKLLVEEEFQAQLQQLQIDKANETIQKISQMTTQAAGVIRQGFMLDQKLKEKELNREYNRRKQQILATIKDEDKQKAALAKLDEEFEGKKSKLKRDAAKKEKGIKIAEATINTAAAVVSMLTAGFPIGIIMAALAAAMGIAQIAIIAATPIPAAAEGGVLPGSQAGTLIRAGENAASEAILPLENEEAQEKIGEALGGQGGNTININIENLFATEDVPEHMAIAIDQALLDLKQEGNSGFATSIQEEQL